MQFEKGTKNVQNQILHIESEVIEIPGSAELLRNMIDYKINLDNHILNLNAI